MASDATDARERFQRLHPSSILFGILRQARGLLLPLLAVLFVTRDSGWERWAALFIIPSTAFELYRYATTRYRLGATDLVLRRGLVMRSERLIPLHRIQNVDLVQNPLHRLFGVAEVRVETAGGAEPEAVLKMLSLSAAHGLRAALVPRGDRERTINGGAPMPEQEAPAERAAILAGSGERDEPCDHGDRAPESALRRPSCSAARAAPELILRIPIGELIRLGLISNRGLAIVFVAIGVGWELNAFDRIGFETAYAWVAERPGLRSPLFITALALGAVLLLRLLSVIWTVLRFHGYELQRTGDDLRVTCGLLTRITATVPRSRIQLVSIHRTLVQRWWGRATVRIETAGGSGGGGEGESVGLQSRRWFVPMVEERDLPRILDAVVPGLAMGLQAATWRPLSARARHRMMKRAIVLALLMVAAGLAAAGVTGVIWISAVGLLLAAVGVWHVHHESRALAYAMEGESILFRSGAWSQRLSVVRFARIQVVSATQSPFDRRWRMATVCVDTAGAGAAEHTVRIPFQPADEAEALLNQLVRETEDGESMEALGASFRAAPVSG